MSEKSEALRLAAELEACPTINYKAHAAELRRQDKEIEALKARAESAEANLCNTQIAWENWKVMHSTTRLEAEMQRKAAAYDGLIAQRDALRAELKEATEAINDPAVNNLRTLPESIRVLCAQRDALLEGYRKMKNVAKNVAASYSNFCDDNGTRRRLEREFDAADAIVRAVIKMMEEGK